jgi:DNA-binding NarL/FixJ family response regulator
MYPDLRKVSLWIVEDNEQYRDTIVMLVNRTESIECRQAFGSCEPLFGALKKHPLPEIVLMDIGLPGMDGIEGTRILKQRCPSTDIIMLTSFDEDEKIFKAICAGATGYLVKSSTEEEIIGSIQQILDGGSPINPQIARRILQLFTTLATPRKDYGLSERELEILRLMVSGHTKKQIADRLFLSYHTIDSHARNIYAKLQVNTCSGAVGKALSEHLI